MELHTRVALLDSLLEDAEHKRTALTHVLHAHELAEQGNKSTHGTATLTVEEEGLHHEHELWQSVERRLAEMRTLLDEIEQLERQRGVGE